MLCMRHTASSSTFTFCATLDLAYPQTIRCACQPTVGSGQASGASGRSFGECSFEMGVTL